MPARSFLLTGNIWQIPKRSRSHRSSARGWHSRLLVRSPAAGCRLRGRRSAVMQAAPRLSAYEKQRELRIAENSQLLHALGLDTPAIPSRPHRARSAARAAKKEKPRPERAEPARKSARFSEETPAALEQPGRHFKPFKHINLPPCITRHRPASAKRISVSFPDVCSAPDVCAESAFSMGRFWRERE